MLPVACDWVEPFLLQPKAFSAPHPWEELIVVSTGWVRCHSAVWACWHASEIPSVWKVCAVEESSLNPRSMDSSRELPWNSQRTLGLHDLECIGKEEGNTTYLLKSQVGKTEKGKTLANQQYPGWSFFCFPDQRLMVYKDEGRRAGWKDSFSWWCFLSELSEAVISSWSLWLKRAPGRELSHHWRMVSYGAVSELSAPMLIPVAPELLWQQRRATDQTLGRRLLRRFL